MEDEHSFELEKEAFNDLFIGKDYSTIKGQDIGNIDRHIGESDLLGVNCMDALNKDVCAVVGDESGVLPLETATLRKDRGCLEALEPNDCSKPPVQAAQGSPNFKTLEDAHIMGLHRELADKASDKSVTENVRVVGQFPLTRTHDFGLGEFQSGVLVDMVNGASFFSEMDYNYLGGKLKSKKKYSSMFEIQDKVCFDYWKLAFKGCYGESNQRVCALLCF
ncbi:hypothetical protein V6N12_052461 [Hibiscus sabdariffa]|uniref:Uncharacterized protein n=1 Tax=Hibiscus sabdariffa TaxID=183260 RepID=A0ABR1ZGE4_9ROSI